MMRALILLAALGGCTLFPLQEADCRGVDWERRGFAHGFAGYHSQYMRLAPECSQRFGVEVPEAVYEKGWKDGRFEWERLHPGGRRGL